MSAAAPPSLALRRRLLEAFVHEAPALGWTAAALSAAARVAGLSDGEARLAAPRGVADLAEAFCARADDEMTAALARLDLASMRVRDRVGAAIRARLKVQAPDKAAAAALARWLARPSRAPLAASLVWRSADAVWRALGDRSTDENFYSKRVILAGVLTAVYVRWHADEDPAMAATHASIEARIDNVMQFEKLKARARPLGRWAESAVAAAARARYRSP